MLKKNYLVMVFLLVAVLLSGCSGVPGEFDKTQLAQVIKEAETLLSGTEVGKEVGQVPQAAYNRLKAAVDSANNVNKDSETTQPAVDAAVFTLESRVDEFYKSIVSPYIFAEDFSEATDVGAWESPNHQGGLSIATSDDPHYGKYLHFNLGNENSRSFQYQFSTEAQVAGKHVLEIDLRMKTGDRDGGQFAISAPNAAIKDNWHLDNGYVVKFDYTPENIYTVNDVPVTAEMPNNGWINIRVVMDFDDGTSVVTILDAESSKVLFDDKVAMANGVYNLGGLYFRCPRYGSEMSIDNIKLYPASFL